MTTGPTTRSCALLLLLLGAASPAPGCDANTEEGAEELDGGAIGATPATSCYSPCESFVITDGVLRECSAEGLMDGCLDDDECVDGSCVPAAGTVEGALSVDDGVVVYPHCTSTFAGQCLAHQRCFIEEGAAVGSCHSECDAVTPCPEEARCLRHVCLPRCTETADCAAGDAQQTCDPKEGVCRTLIAPSGSSSPPVFDAVAVTPTSIGFSKSGTSAPIEITNNTAMARMLTIAKAEQRVNAGGAAVVLRRGVPGGAPLTWLKLDKKSDDSIEVEVGPGKTVIVEVSGARHDAIPDWTGALVVEGEGLLPTEIALSYQEGTAGRWTGSIYTFAAFADGAEAGKSNPVSKWIDSGRGKPPADAGNVFMNNFHNFRKGALSREQATELVDSLITGSWAFPETLKTCSKLHGSKAICVPSANPDGVLKVSSDKSSEEMPSGMIELSFSMDLGPSDSKECLSGRVATERALHYPGNPAIDVCFDGNPDNCKEAEGESCRLAVTSMDAVVEIGGRYPLTGGKCMPDYQAKAVPWLVPGFLVWSGATGDSDGLAGAGESVTCLESAESDTALSNPLTDGRRLERRLELVDGVLIDQRQMALILREQTSLFGAGEPIYSYSYALLERTAAEDLVTKADPPSKPPESLPSIADVQPGCSTSLVKQVTGKKQLGELSATALRRLARVLVQGHGGDVGTDPGELGPDEFLHYICVWSENSVDGSADAGGANAGSIKDLTREMMDGGPNGDESCPPYAQPVYFTLDEASSAIGQYYMTIHPAGGAHGHPFFRFTSLNADIDDSLIECEAPSGVGDPESSEVEQLTALDGFHDTAGFQAFKLACVAEDLNAKLPTHQCNTYEVGKTGESCLGQLEKWVSQTGGKGLRVSTNAGALMNLGAATAAADLTYRCADPTLATCDENRFDMRDGKIFFAAQSDVTFKPLETDIYDAFRYKTQFVSRTGKNVGFAPSLCSPGADLNPYCYDPVQLDDVSERVDCALSLYHSHLEAPLLNPAEAVLLRDYLRKSFSALQKDNPEGDPIVELGFERLLAELLIMNGDDGYVASFATRFDLAATAALAFEGTAFEGDAGVDASGALGYELYKLYEATQYYERVTNRFFSTIPLIVSSLAWKDDDRYVQSNDPKIVTEYIERVVRASTRNAATWQQIARRYQDMNKPELARQVMERTYARTFHESMILSELMRRIIDQVASSQKAAIRSTLEDAQRRYRVAMSDMQALHVAIVDRPMILGFAPDFIPFPALDETEVNAFEVIIERAKQRLDIASAREEDAIAQTREFDTDQETFNSEIVNIRNNYEGQLGEICGTFVGPEGRVYPLIAKYLYLWDGASEGFTVGLPRDPCGSLPVGALYLKAFDLETRRLELEKVLKETEFKVEDIEVAKEKTLALCKIIDDDAEAWLKKQQAVDELQAQIDKTQFTIGAVERHLENLNQVLDVFKDVHKETATAFEFSYGTSGIAKGTHTVAAVKISMIGVTQAAASLASAVTTSVLEAKIVAKEKAIRDKERTYEKQHQDLECDKLEAEEEVTIKNLHQDLDLLELDLLNAEWNVDVEISLLKTMDHDRKRLMALWDEAEQLAVNAAAAKTDPNIRIYKNDAIINAERAFARAQQETYRATLVYEYYTGSTYGDREKLFLTRMVFAGEQNLLDYVYDLEDAFFEFENDYGNPDTRVHIVSLRDDILHIDRNLTDAERVERFRKALADPGSYDELGRLRFQFDTNFGLLSPLTRNHKVLFVEVNIDGAQGSTGDNVARIYVAQSGAGTVRGTDNGERSFLLPDLTAVVNPFMNGNRDLQQFPAIPGATASIYRGFRLRDRPFVNSSWELVLDLHNESVNQDIVLSGLNDIQLFVYYTDFTSI